jgi:hypothetical protein
VGKDTLIFPHQPNKPNRNKNQRHKRSHNQPTNRHDDEDIVGISVVSIYELTYGMDSFKNEELKAILGGLISIWRCRIRGCSTQKVLLKVTDPEF